MKLPYPANEAARLVALEQHELANFRLDSGFDDLVTLAAEICDAPMAMITVIGEDRQWIKSGFGFQATETSRDTSFCTHAICEEAIFIVPDALEDARFASNPFVTEDPHIRFYAGVPLRTTDGHAMGTLCVLDRVPRKLTERQEKALRVLSRHVSTQFELRRVAILRREAEERLARTNEDLERRVAARTEELMADISARKVAEKELDAERRVSDAIIASLPGMFYLFDENFNYLRWNEYAERVTGLTNGEYGKTHSLEKVAPEDRQRLAVEIRNVFNAGSGGLEARIQHRSGSQRWHLLTGQQVTLEGRRCLLGIGIDIDDRKAAESALAETSSRLELAVRAGGIGIWAWDTLTDETYYSEDYRRQLGYAEEDFPNHLESWKSHLHPDDLARVTAYGASFIASNDCEYSQKFRLRHRSGEYRWVHSRAHLYRDEEGKPMRMLGCHIDIMDSRAMEEALSESRSQLRALAEHQHSVREKEAARISRELHDELGAALTGLKLDVSWIGRRVATMDCDQSKAVGERLGLIEAQLDQTIGGVRTLCQALRPAVLDQLGLAEAIDWQCGEFKTRTGVGCQVEREDLTTLDSSKAIVVFRILQELLTNVSRHAGATQVVVRAHCVEHHFVLEVSDNGCGLPPDALKRRDRFGLVGVGERALAASGTVDFSLRPGGGTTVKVTFPTYCERES